MTVKITMIGTGYVGLVTGACLAELGHSVICVDKDTQKIEMLLNGKMPIYEPGLNSLVARNVDNGRLTFTTNVIDSSRNRDAIFLCVGTPTDPETGRADLSYVFEAAKEIGSAVDGFTVVVTKSTVPVGTNRNVLEVVNANKASDAVVAVASNPEFLREGAAITDFMEPDRVVVGVDAGQAENVMRSIYQPLVDQDTPLLATDIETAEMIKYAANSFLAVKLSFINEVSDLCEAVGANIEDVSKGIGLDKRIGASFLKVGPGWGGSCFPKDTCAFHRTAEDVGAQLQIVSAAIDANNRRKSAMADRIVKACGGSVAGKKIAVFGLTFKGQTDDMRESPSLEILPRLIALGANVHGFDPSHSNQAPALLPGVTIEASPESAVHDADALILMTEWREFLSYDYDRFAEVMSDPVMIDLRNHLSAESVLQAGFEAYHRLGVAEVKTLAKSKSLETPPSQGEKDGVQWAIDAFA